MAEIFNSYPPRTVSNPENRWVVERDGEEYHVDTNAQRTYSYVEPGFAAQQEIATARQEVDAAHETAGLVEGIAAATNDIIETRAEALSDAGSGTETAMEVAV